MILAVAAALAEQADGVSFFQTSNLIGWLTVFLLSVSGVILPATYWYIANRPSVVVRAKWEEGIAAVVISNEGRTAARDVDVRCPSMNLERHQTKGDDAYSRYPLLHPGQQIEYYVSGVSEAIEQGPYEFAIRHRRWLARWLVFARLRYVERAFRIDFDSYRNALIRGESSTLLTDHLENLTRNVDAVLTALIDKHDRWRYRRLAARARARRARERLKQIVTRSNGSS